MKLIKGVKSDTTFEDQPVQSMTWAHNVMLSDKFGAVTTEYGFTALELGVTGNIIGGISLWDERIVIFLDTSEIGVVSVDNVYTSIYADVGLNFSSNYPVRGVARTVATGDTEIAWTDGENGMRFLNITAELEGRGITDVTQVEYLTQAIIPTIDINSVVTGGSVSAGAYRFTARYQRADDSYTPYFTPEGAVPIYEDSLDNNFLNIEGSDGGTATNKQILLDISNIDGRYKAVEVIVVSKIAGIVTANKFASIPIRTSCVEANDCTDTFSITLPFTGDEVLIAVDLEELTQVVPRYTKAQTLTYHTDKRLYWSNLEREAPLDIQKYINNISVNWEVERAAVDELDNSYKDGTYTFKTRGYMPNEVYALYFVPILNNGQLGEAYHIPGRAANDGDTDVLVDADPVTYADDVFIDDNVLRFHTRNTATLDTTTGNSGTMGYWHNLDEEYDNTDCWLVYDSSDSQVGDLRCTNVRHHKFPSIRQLNEWGIPFITNVVGPGGGGSYMPVLNIKLSNVWLPDSIREQMQGFHIFYAERNTTNSTVLGTSPLTYSANYNPDRELLNTNAANVHYEFADLTLDLDPEYVRLHPFNLLNGNLSTSNFNFLRMEMLGVAGWELLSDQEDGAYEGGDANITRATWLIGEQWNSSEESDVIRAVDEAQYFGPNIAINDNETNISSEQCIRVKLQYNGAPELINDATDDNSPNVYPALTMPTPRVNLAPPDFIDTFNENYQGDLVSYGFPIFTYFVTMNQYVRNTYFDFLNQTLLVGGSHLFDHCEDEVLDEATTYSLHGGDTFVGVWGFKQQFDGGTTAPIADATPEEIEVQDGISKALHIFPEYGPANIGLRNEGTGETEIQWPKRANNTLTDYEFLQASLYTADNYYGYNTDYSWVNNLGITLVNDSCSANSQEIVIHPARTIRSLEVDPTDNLTSWREYLEADYFDNVQDKGPIFRIASFDDTLFIHHRNALYRTRGVQALQTDADAAYVGQGNIFQFAPKELVPANHGYAGIQSHFAGIVTKQGYIFVDQDGGRIFVVSSGIEEISSDGIKEYAYKNLPESTIQTNPFLQQSVVVGYDVEYNRMLISKTGAWTLGYNFDLAAWEGSKSYVASLYIGTQKRLLNLDQGTLYQHNVPERQGRFYNDTPEESWVDVVLNPAPTITKMFSVIKWITLVENGEGVAYYNSTIDKIEVYTKHQYSGPIDLAQWNNLRNLRRTWNMNGLRDLKLNDDVLVLDPNTRELQADALDLAKDFSETRRFIDKYVVARLTYLNTLTDRKLHILDVDVAARQFNR